MSGGWPVQSGHEPHQTGLARKRRAKQHVERACRKRQRNIGDMGLGPDDLRDITQFQHGLLLSRSRAHAAPGTDPATRAPSPGARLHVLGILTHEAIQPVGFLIRQGQSQFGPTP